MNAFIKNVDLFFSAPHLGEGEQFDHVEPEIELNEIHKHEFWFQASSWL